MSEHSCCYKCPRRTAGCGVGCPDWEDERAERRRKYKKPNPDKIYMGYFYAQHNKIVHQNHLHRNEKKGGGHSDD